MSSNQPMNPQTAGRTLLIICGGLVAGPLVFLVIVAAMAQMQPSWTAAGPVTWIGAGIAVVSLLTACFLPGLLARSMIQRAKQDLPRGEVGEANSALLRIATTASMNKYIIRFALLEGAAFLCAIGALLEGNWVALAVALFMIAVMLAMFPWPPRFESTRDDLLQQFNDRR